MISRHLYSSLNRCFLQANRDFQEEEKRRLKERQERQSREGSNGEVPVIPSEEMAPPEPRPDPPEIPEDLREECEDEDLEMIRKQNTD